MVIYFSKIYILEESEVIVQRCFVNAFKYSIKSQC